MDDLRHGVSPAHDAAWPFSSGDESRSRVPTPSERHHIKQNGTACASTHIHMHMPACVFIRRQPAARMAHASARVCTTTKHMRIHTSNAGTADEGLVIPSSQTSDVEPAVAEIEQLKHEGTVDTCLSIRSVTQMSQAHFYKCLPQAVLHGCRASKRAHGCPYVGTHVHMHIDY